MKYKKTGIVLRAYRDSIEITQGEISKRLKLHVQFVSNWERGLCLPPLSAMRNIYASMTDSQKKAFHSAVRKDLTKSYMDKLGVGL